MIDYSSEFDRRLLRGIMRYSNENGPWLFYRVSSEPNAGESRYAEVIDIARKWKADAIIGRWDEAGLDQLHRINIPVVLQNYRNRTTAYSTITGDYKGTGKMAADFFYSRCYSSFAFFGIRGILWSEERKVGFREAVIARGGMFSCFEISENEKINRRALVSWLKGLPDRTAMFCCDDQRALIITETCKIEGIEIPSQIAVLGVDNDDLICCISDPPISSIELENEQGGYLLAQQLHRQIAEHDASRFCVTINPIRVNERQSTSYCVTDPAVLKLVNFINSNYTKDIRVEELVEMVSMSRRSIESKFKREMKMSIYQYVLDCRIDRVAQLLLTTDEPLTEIAVKANIQDYKTLLNLFKKRYGCTPNMYRHKICVFPN